MTAQTTAPGLYIHVPFCARACPYCDFDFEVGRSPDATAFVQALERERTHRGIETGLPVRTVYLGGGTPSQLGAAGLTGLLAWVADRFDLTATVERTVELNPEHVDGPLLHALVDAGVHRVSMGVQSLLPDALATLGRVHQARQATAALRAAVAAGLQVSADLIVGWPGQRPQQVREEVEGLLDTGIDHVSIYALTIEPGTPWTALVSRGRRSMPDADAQAECLRAAETRLMDAGLEHYEVA
ncbi:MAG: radical SAM protein, partial [Deltaproteobacteria bacterium]|nr:radical SAM protein [Deltaproteobacteria bacterium]